MAEPYGLEIIEAAQQRCASNEIVWHAEISLPARGQHHRREMPTGGAATHMNSCGIAAEFARMRAEEPPHARANCPCTSAGDVEPGHGAGAGAAQPRCRTAVVDYTAESRRAHQRVTRTP